MAKRQPVKPGQPITAKFLNTPQADDPAQGWGEQQASLTAQFKASEDFTTFEDLYRGNCKRYWRDRGSSAYAVNGADEYVYAWSAISSGEIFPAIYNRQSGRWEAISATAASGGSGGSGGGGLATNNCCDTIYLAGSVDLDGLEWATDYTITLAAPIGTVTVTDQGSGTWESDVVDVTCTVDEVTVTDEYTVTMTATGNAPGEVIVTVALTLGAGYGGASGCCDTTSTGFAWKFVNCCIVDPLAGWTMTRDPSGFSGQECEIGGCEICVTPTTSGLTLPCLDPASLLPTGVDVTVPSSWQVVVAGADGVANDTEIGTANCPYYGSAFSGCTARPEYIGPWYNYKLKEARIPPDPAADIADTYYLTLRLGIEGSDINGTYVADATGTSLGSYSFGGGSCTGLSSLCQVWYGTLPDTPVDDDDPVYPPGSFGQNIVHGHVRVAIYAESVTESGQDYVKYRMMWAVWPTNQSLARVVTYLAETQWLHSEFSKEVAEAWINQTRSSAECGSISGVYADEQNFAIPSLSIAPVV